MNKILFLFAASLSAYELTICGIFHNDARYLPEWIEFHLEQGVEHFYLYNHLSTDDPRKALEPYMDLVTLIDWPHEYTKHSEWNTIQCSAYLHCVKNYKRENKWVAFLDTDEFLFNPDFRPLRDLLEEYEEYGAVGVHWATYGSSQKIVPDGESLLQNLVMRAPLDFEYNRFFKTIAQVNYVSKIINPHCCVLKGGKVTVDENKRDTGGSSVGLDISFEKFRINHYWCRDLSYFYEVKIPRQEKWFGGSKEYRNGRIEIESQMNLVYDPILKKER